MFTKDKTPENENVENTPQSSIGAADVIANAITEVTATEPTITVETPQPVVKTPPVVPQPTVTPVMQSLVVNEPATTTPKESAMTQEYNGQENYAQTFHTDSWSSWLEPTTDAEVTRLAELVRTCIMERANAQLKPNHMLHILTREKDTGSFSAIVLSVRMTVKGQLKCVHHTLVVESSRKEHEPLYKDTPNGKIQVLVPTSEVYNEHFQEKVLNKIRQDYRDQALFSYSTGLQVIPRSVKIENIDDIFKYVKSAVAACQTLLSSMDSRAPKFSIPHMQADKRTRITSRTAVDEQTTGFGTLPTRSDIVTEMHMMTDNGGDSVFESRTEVLVARTSGYVDLTYVDPAPNSLRTYLPRLTITQIDTDMASSPLEAALLGLANLTILGRNMAFGIAFKQQYGNRGNVNLRDFGAVGLQVPRLTPEADGPCFIDVSASDTELRRLMETVLLPSIVYSLDIEPGSISSWMTNIFADAAAMNTNTGAKARLHIISAADTLTGGRFSQNLLKRARAMGEVNDISTIQLVRNSGDQCHTGYYVSEGVKRDIREIDLLALLNLQGEKDPETINQFLSTFDRDQNIMVRLDQRARILKAIVSGVELRGYSTKYDLMTHFVEALVESIEQTGLTIASNTAGLRGEARYTQNVNDWVSVMVNPNIGNTMFNSGGYNGGNQNYPSNPYTGAGNGADYYNY